MIRTMLNGKIHRATVTHADLNYVGSITIDATLLRAANILPGEKVAVVDVTNGARLETYVIEGVADSGVIGVNGAAAHLVHPDDIVIVMAYCQLDDAEARDHLPHVVHVDASNRIQSLGDDPGAPADDRTQRSPLSATR